MPELPDQLVERLISEYGITKYDANVIAEEKEYVTIMKIQQKIEMVN